jgi:hypothetical protein
MMTRLALGFRDLAWPLALALGLTGVFPGCLPTPAQPDVVVGPSPAPATADPQPGPTPVAPSTIRFRDVSETSGVTFTHRSGNGPEKYFPTCLGSGVALIDYDGDGWLDLYFATTRDLPLSAPDRSRGNRLYRNRGNGTFEDVTDRAGVGFQGFNHGVAVGDVDNNGYPDLYLTNLGPNVLYLNNGDGTFRDATRGSGLECPLWSCGAAFLDYDNDGWLDLYVANYGEWSDDGPHPFCGDQSRGLRSICSPTLIPPQRHFLFRNKGDGTFEDRTEAAGVLRRDGRGMGVVAADLNADGWIDLYIANDKCPNFLFINRGDGTFDDVSESSGAAYSMAGEAQGSMGVDAEDVDGDGLPELLVTNFRGEGIALYHNLGGGNFLEHAGPAGVVKGSKPYVGWGCALTDLDGDGRPDLVVVNGHVDDNLNEFGKDVPQAEPAKVWRQERGGIFREVAAPGTFFARDHVARGVSFGDLDNDGDTDVVVSIMEGHPAVLLNESAPGPWLRLELVGRRSNRSAIGAAVVAYRGEHAVAWRQVKGGGSYLSANDPRVLITPGAGPPVDRVEVRWPSGAFSTLSAPEMGRTHRVIEPEEGPPQGTGAGGDDP